MNALVGHASDVVLLVCIVDWHFIPGPHVTLHLKPVFARHRLFDRQGLTALQIPLLKIGQA